MRAEGNAEDGGQALGGIQVSRAGGLDHMP